MSLAEDIECQVGYLENCMENCYDNAKRKIWETKDGRKIPYSKMTTSHLINTITFITRKPKDHWMYAHLEGLQDEYTNRVIKMKYDKDTDSVYKYLKDGRWKNYIMKMVM